MKRFKSSLGYKSMSFDVVVTDRRCLEDLLVYPSLSTKNLLVSGSNYILYPSAIAISRALLDSMYGSFKYSAINFFV